MRWICLGLLVPLCAAGCTAALIKRGIEPQSLTPERVAEEFGAPAATATDNGESKVTFRTRRKFARSSDADFALWGSIITCGFGELVMFPKELFRLSRTTVLGQEVVVTYGAMGCVYGVTVNGQNVYRQSYTPTPDEANAQIPSATEPARPASGP